MIFKNTPFVAGIGIYQEKRVNSVVSDALAPHIASSLVAMVLTKWENRSIRCGKLPLCICVIVA